MGAIWIVCDAAFGVWNTMCRMLGGDDIMTPIATLLAIVGIALSAVSIAFTESDDPYCGLADLRTGRIVINLRTAPTCVPGADGGASVDIVLLHELCHVRENDFAHGDAWLRCFDAAITAYLRHRGEP